MDQLVRAILFAVFPLILASPNDEARGREGKFMNVFQVISFPNGPCEGSGNRNGTCYTEQECESRGGTNSGSCASGFGVCCTITLHCGETTMENCTYFESDGARAGACQVEICPCNDNICQLRLDFDTFVISGPSTSTNTVTFRRQNGGAVTAKATDAATRVPLTEYTQCLTDTFTVTNPNGINPPTICGTNSGEHMYVDSSDDCNKLVFTMGNNAVGAPIASRSWQIKVSQYSCNYPNLAPQGCTQYFFGSNTAQVRSYNFNNGGGTHLASQDQTICVRRERNYCRICWMSAATTDFALTGGNRISSNGAKVTQAVKSLRNDNRCCDYAAPRSSTMLGFDCVLIPGNVNDQAPFNPRPAGHCGNNGLKGGTTCSTRTPFLINFRSDRFEPVLEVSAIAGINNAPSATAAGNNRGFQLTYTQDSISCNPESSIVP